MRRRRRHFADAAAADRNWSARRRRPNVGVAPAPFSWRVHVMLYTSYMLLDSVMSFTTKLEHWQKAVRTMRACFAMTLDTQMKHCSVKAKVFLLTISWKLYLMLKVSYRTSLEIRLIKRMIQWNISTACTVITAYKVAKWALKAYKDIVSTKKFVTTFWMLSKNAGNFQYSVRPCQHWGDWKLGNGKRETEKWH